MAIRGATVDRRSSNIRAITITTPHPRDTTAILHSSKLPRTATTSLLRSLSSLTDIIRLHLHNSMAIINHLQPNMGDLQCHPR